MEELGTPRLFFPFMRDKFAMFANEVTRRSVIPCLALLAEIYG